MEGVLIRKATLEDLDVLLTFEQGIITAERPFDPTLAKDPIRYYDIGALISSEQAEVVVATYQSQIVSSGYALIKKAKPYLDHDNYVYLGFMYTHPDFRRKGINAKILEALQLWASEKGISEIRLSVYDENPGAIRAYAKFGFKKYLVEMRMPRDIDTNH